MTLKDLSSEQQDLVRLALDGKNVLCDACIGSGKTSTINVLCNEFDSSKEILYLTYNRLLKLDAQEKILNDNVTVQNYHGFASKILYRRGIKNVGQGEQIGMVLRKRVPVGHFDVLIIDEYQDINEEISKMLEYIKESNPGLQIIAVGDMKQKIYDQTSLDIWSFIHKFLGKHTQVNFTQCFRLSHDLAQRLGNIWGKDINGVNKNCKVSTMSREQVVDYLDTKNPKDVLCLGARTGSMVKVLNELEARPGNLYDKNHVYASIKEPDGEKHVAPGADVGIFTTFDGSKGMERPICVVFDFTESYWCSRVFQPTARYEILRNLFCVAASRGKDEVIFVEPPKKEDRFGLVSDKTLMTPVKMNQEFNTKFDISEMFDFKFDEDVEHCYQLINTTPVFHKDVHEIEIKHSDAMIDLAPCISIYQQANFFDYYDIDSAIAFYMYLHNDKKVALPSSWKSVEEKVLFLTMLMTSQDRYVKQVELPFITRAQETDLNKRLSMVFTPDESVQERCELTAMVDTKAKKKLVISGMADVVKDNKVYLLKFVSSLAHKHFLQCACYMLATGLKQGVVWNIRDNMMYEIEIPDPDKFLDAVITCITKQVFAKAESYGKIYCDLKNFFNERFGIESMSYEDVANQMHDEVENYIRKTFTDCYVDTDIKETGTAEAKYEFVFGKKRHMFNNISFTANPISSSDAIVLFLANQSEWAKEYVEKMLEEQEWSLKHIRRQVSIERYKEQKLAEYKKAPSEDLIQAKLFHDLVPKSGQVKVTLDIGGKQFVGSFDSKFFGYTGANLDEAILPEAGFKYPDSFEGYYEFLKDNGINVECKDGMFPFAFVKEIAAFRGDKIFWKREA